MDAVTLRKLIMESLLEQGFRIDNGQVLPPANMDKDKIRELHSLAVRYRIEKSKGGLYKYEPRLLTRIATGGEVTPERIEWGRGIFDRRVDNLDMFRVIDLKMRRTVFDCIFGIGRVGLVTTDKTDPEFDFEKIRSPRQLYDIIKEASLDADQRNRVIHLE